MPPTSLSAKGVDRLWNPLKFKGQLNRGWQDGSAFQSWIMSNPATGRAQQKKPDRKCPIKNNFFKRVKIRERRLSHIHSLLRHHLGSDKTWWHFPHLSGQTHKTSSLWSKSSTVPPLWKATWHRGENKQTVITISFFLWTPSLHQ